MGNALILGGWPEVNSALLACIKFQNVIARSPATKQSEEFGASLGEKISPALFMNESDR
jgi:hypothetical protein